MLNPVKKLIIKILNVKLGILLEYQNIKAFLQEAMFQIDVKKFLWLKKLKTLFLGHILLVLLKTKKLLEPYKNESQKTSQKEFRVEKVVKRKGNKLYVKWEN